MLIHSNYHVSTELAAKFASIGLVLLIIWQLISGSMMIDKLYKQNLTQLVQTKPISQLDKKEKKFLNTAFFGDYIPQSIGEIKKSMLNVKVVGILYSTREADSQAIIKTADGQEQTYRKGDKLPGGVVIQRITPDGVLVMHNNSLESLSLPKNELIFAPPPRFIEPNIPLSH